MNLFKNTSQEKANLQRKQKLLAESQAFGESDSIKWEAFNEGDNGFTPISVDELKSLTLFDVLSGFCKILMRIKCDTEIFYIASDASTAKKIANKYPGSVVSDISKLAGILSPEGPEREKWSKPETLKIFTLMASQGAKLTKMKKPSWLFCINEIQ